MFVSLIRATALIACTACVKIYSRLISPIDEINETSLYPAALSTALVLLFYFIFGSVSRMFVVGALRGSGRGLGCVRGIWEMGGGVERVWGGEWGASHRRVLF